MFRKDPCHDARRDGESELLDSVLAAETPESKLGASVSLAALLSVVAVVVSSLVGKDPFGA